MDLQAPSLPKFLAALASIAVLTMAWTIGGAQDLGDDVNDGSAPVVSPADPRPRRVVNVTRDLQFQIPFMSLGVSPTNPDIAYLGTASGRIHATRDGGKTWTETKALVGRSSFVGSIRPTGPAGYRTNRVDAAVGARFKPRWVLDPPTPPEDIIDPEWVPDPDVGDRGLGVRLLDSNVAGRWFDDAPQATPPLLGGGGGGGGARLGVGLRAGSPYLTLALRKKRGWAIGINIKQTLALYGTPPTKVIWIDVNPKNPDDALAATKDGLLRTTDGGYSWNLVLTGATRWERWMNHVARNPHDPSQIWVSSSIGLQISHDDGTTFERILDSRLATFAIIWTEFHPTNRDIIYVGTTGGLFRSKDGGNEWDWVFVSPWPPQNNVRWIAADPANDQRVLIGTYDGLFASEDAGDKWERVGGLLFTGEPIRGLSASGHPGHFLVATKYDLWETFDGGKTWQVLYYGRIEWDIQAALFAPNDPDTIWVVLWGEILKIVRSGGQPMSVRDEGEFRALVRGEPTIYETVAAARERAGVDLGEVNEYFAGARWGGLLPEINATVQWHRHTLDGEQRFLDFEFVPTRSQGPYERFGFYVGGKWDFQRLVFTPDEVPTGRAYGVMRNAEWRIRQVVIVMYSERRRLQLETLLDRTPDERQALFRKMRIEELTVHLNYLTGGLFKVESAL